GGGPMGRGGRGDGGEAPGAGGGRARQEGASGGGAALGLPEAEIAYASGVLDARGRRITLADLAAERRLAVGASFNVSKITYAGCAVGGIADLDAETGTGRLRPLTLGADAGP